MIAINLHNSLLSCSKNTTQFVAFFNSVATKNISKSIFKKSNAISLYCAICIIKISSSLSKCLAKNKKFFLGSTSENSDASFYLLLQESVPLPTSIPTVLKEAHVHHLTYQTPFESKVRMEEENFQKKNFYLLDVDKQDAKSH